MNNGIIFDLDGTLWDSTPQLTESWNNVLRRHEELNRQFMISDIQNIMGKTVFEIAAALLPELTEKDGVAVINECFEEETLYLRQNGGIIYPDLENTLGRLKQFYKLFIVSNCQDGYIQTFLDHHKLWAYFDDIECFGRTELKKGENIRLIISRNKINKAVYVGDTQSDKDAADIANIPFIHAVYGFGKITGKTRIIHCFSDILNEAKEVLSD